MSTVQFGDTLAAMPLFEGLTPSELAQVSVYLRRQVLPAKTVITTMDQPGDGVWLIVAGTVKIHAEQPNGYDVLLTILGPGELIGEMSLMDSTGRSASVVTQEETALFWMDRVTFEHCLENIPRMTYNLVRILARRVRLANEQVQSLATLDVFGRIARQLLALAQAYGTAALNGDTLIPLALTQGDLASMVGASRVRVNQVLSFFRKCNYIAVDQQARIIVRNHKALALRCR